MEIRQLIYLEQLKFCAGEKVAIYGAATTGEFCQRILKSRDICVECFADDDIQKSETIFHGLSVLLPQDYFVEKNVQYNVIIGSIYFKSIYERICDSYLGLDIVFYDISCLYEQKKYELQKRFMKVHDPDFVWKNYDKLYPIFNNEESKGIIDAMKMVYKKQYDHFDVYKGISTKEEQYITHEMLEFLGHKEVSILDGGAYRGEILSDIIRHNISTKNIYLVEVNQNNFQMMKKNVVSFKRKVSLIPKGLWDEEGMVYLEGEDEACRIVENVTSDRMDVTTIDKIVGENKIDFIKMDIEGAKMHALRGGIKTIKRMRPALAITVYHSPEDFVGIPLYLNDELEGYKFSLLHHTNEYVETILYAFPL